MSKNIFESIEKEYGFLDDYEKQWEYERLKNKNFKQTESKKKQKQAVPEEIRNKVYLNNYPEINQESQNDNKAQNPQILEEAQMFEETKYGRIANKDIRQEQIKSFDDALEAFEVNNIDSQYDLIEEDERDSFSKLQEVVRVREVRFYAFLNKEFNILNKKMFNCCSFCYSNPKLFTIEDANLCTEKCHDNIREAHRYVENLQNEKEEKLTQCLDKAKSMDGQDIMVKFSKCYDEMLFDLDNIEKDIQSEFSNYI